MFQILFGVVIGLVYAWGGLYLLLWSMDSSNSAIEKWVGHSVKRSILSIVLWPIVIPCVFLRFYWLSLGSTVFERSQH